MLPLLASGDPFQHTWDSWVIDFFGVRWDLGHNPTLHSLGISRAVVTMLFVAALLLVAGTLAGREASKARAEGRTARGISGLLEVFVEFIRNEMMKPNMPHHYRSPWLASGFCTFFFFILTCNLLGLLPPPFGFTATGTPWVTAALAFGGTLFMMLINGVIEHGPLGFVAHLAPPSPWWVRWPLLLPIEAFGLLVKCVSLTLRLAANMTAGHIILAVLMGFLTHAFSSIGLKIAVWTPSAIGFAAITVFEIVIAFIQAYIFTVLSTVFVGQMVSHEH